MARLSLLAENPKVAAEWHPTKNGNLQPSDFTAGSGKRVWWKCQNGPDHEWETTIGNRTKGSGCPFCAGYKVSITNNLYNNFPEIAKEWHPKRNGNLTPNDVVFGTHKKVWWECQKGPDHEWEASVVTRTSQGLGCPFCAGKRASVTNSFHTIFPELSKMWHTEKNGDLSPHDIVSKSKKKFWWKCPDGPDHEWISSPGNLTRWENTNGCPFCAGRKVSVTNSLMTMAPDIMKIWHPEKNVGLTPNEIGYGSNKKVWWKCYEGADHEWMAGITDVYRISKIDSGIRVPCPFCRGLKVSITNCLDNIHPEVASQWHPTKNGNLQPSDVVAGSNKKYWWKCAEGPDHEWRTSPDVRISRGGRGCPFCAGYKVSITNNLYNNFPEIAKEWHPTKNGNLQPSDVVAGSNKKYWWKCTEGPDHEWSAVIGSRTRLGAKCPCCAGLKISITNSLATLYPTIASEWHPTKNGDLQPSDVVAGSNKKYWWKCNDIPEHNWKTSIDARTRAGTACPDCAPFGFRRDEEGYYYCMELIGPSETWWYKGGISFDPEVRKKYIESSLINSKLPLKVVIIEKIKFEEGIDAMELEKKLLKIKSIRIKTKEKFAGSSELFNCNPLDYARKQGWV